VVKSESVAEARQPEGREVPRLDVSVNAEQAECGKCFEEGLGVTALSESAINQ
jgi:hypothetical protein